MANYRKRVSYVILGMYFFFGKIEYAVILPTLWMNLHSTFDAEEYFFGLVLSSFKLASMIAAPVFGRWADIKREPKIIIMIGALFGMTGNFMYFVGISKWWLLASRFIAGIGMGVEPVMIAEIARTTTEKERTGIISTIMLIRQSGLLIGPGFNIFLRLADFKIGPFVVNKYTDPGAFLVCIWCFEFFLLLICYKDLHIIKENSLIENSTDKLSNERSTCYESVTGTSINSCTSSGEKDFQLKQQPTTEHPNVNPDVKEQKLTLKFLYETYMREEVVTLLGALFISNFCQVSVTVLATPLTARLFHWGELENSIMYCIAAAVMILVFIILKIVSKFLQDRTMILIGSCLLAVTNAWILYFVPQSYKDTPSHNLPKFVITYFLDMLAIPFLMTCGTSLFTKIIPNEIQGFSAGIQSITVGIAVILAPLWTGSTLQWPFLMTGVIFGLVCVSMLMLLLSYDRLLPASETKQKSVSENISKSDKEISSSVRNSSGSDTDISGVKKSKTFPNMAFDESTPLVP